MNNSRDAASATGASGASNVHSLVTATCRRVTSALVCVSARRAGGVPAVTDDVTVTRHTADVTPPVDTVCAILDTEGTTAASHVKQALMEAAVKLVVATVKTIITALRLMEHVIPVRLVGTVPAVTAHVHQVSMVMAANRHVHAAERMSPVTHKQGNVGGVTLDGLDPDVKSLVPMELMVTLAAFYVTHVLMGAAITSPENVFVNQAFREKIVTAAALLCILA